SAQRVQPEEMVHVGVADEEPVDRKRLWKQAVLLDRLAHPGADVQQRVVGTALIAKHEHADAGADAGQPGAAAEHRQEGSVAPVQADHKLVHGCAPPRGLWYAASKSPAS